VRHQKEQSMLIAAEALSAHGWQRTARASRVLAAYRSRVGWDDETLKTAS
jgi:hypothetical protein